MHAVNFGLQQQYRQQFFEELTRNNYINYLRYKVKKQEENLLKKYIYM